MAKRNVQSQQDAFADLASWTTSIKKKDTSITDREKEGKRVLEKVRSKRQKHVVVVDSEGSEVEEDEEDDEAEAEERTKMAVEYKDQGNEHFKMGQFEEAINCYTMAQSLDPTNPVYPANRAMASLKVKKWSEAEEDCTRALKHDHQYQKALFRRAQARDQLGKLDGAEMDYQAVLKLEPANKAAKKQLAMLRERLHQNVKFTLDRPENCSKSRLVEVPVREINNKHINSIGEVGEKIRAEESKRKVEQKPAEPIRLAKTEVPIKKEVENVPAESSVKPTEPMKTEKPTEKVKIKFNKPTSSLDLERDWRSMSQTQKADYLRFIDDATLTARCFSSTLPKYIVDICSVLSDKMTDNVNDARLAHELLKQLNQVPRFATTMFFLLDNEKVILRQMLEKLSVHVTVSAQLTAAYTA